MNQLLRIGLSHELKQFLKSVDPETRQEEPFAKIMPTKRKFRADFYLPGKKIIIEVNGGQYIGGRHNRGGKGYETDLDKINLATSNGFKVFQFTYEMLKRNEYRKLFSSIGNT